MPNRTGSTTTSSRTKPTTRRGKRRLTTPPSGPSDTPGGPTDPGPSDPPGGPSDPPDNGGTPPDDGNNPPTLPKATGGMPGGYAAGFERHDKGTDSSVVGTLSGVSFDGSNLSFGLDAH